MLDEHFLSSVGAVVLAAGKGTRLNCTDCPKVMLEIGGKPIVWYAVDILKKIGFVKEHICLVVGFHKEKVMDYFGDEVSYAVQEEQKGTAHAAYVGIKTLPPCVRHVLVMNGDDSAFYTPDTLEMLLNRHISNNNTLTLLTAEINNPDSIGRVVRKESGEVIIVEKEHLSEEQKKLKEISTNTFVFNRAWYEGMYPAMPPIPKLNEFGLPTALAMVKKAQLVYEVVKLSNPQEWFGINTPEELEEARRRK